MQCKHFGVCGGCSLPGVPYAEQLLRKQARLAQLVGRPVPPLIPSPREDRFRSKSAFVFGPEGQGRGLVMGHYAARSRQIVRIDECPVHSDRGNRIAFALRDRLIRARIYGAGAQRNGLVRHIIVRTTADDRQAVAMLVVTRNDKALRTPIRGLLASADRPDGFFINIHDKPSPYMVGPETIRIDGHSHVKETIGATSYLVSPTAFFQTNVGAAGELVKLVIEGMDKPTAFAPGASAFAKATADKSADKKGLSPPTADKGSSSPTVLDLYSGSGLFALPIAQAGARVTAVEESRQAVKDAEANLRLNRIAGGQVRLVCARVEDVLPRLAADRWDAVVLDPPRQGCPPAVLSGVFDSIAPQRVIYVSCNPDALAQDLPVILKAGYLVTHLQAVDMFPHTDHIETVAVFTRGMNQLTKIIVIVSTLSAAFAELHLAMPGRPGLWWITIVVTAAAAILGHRAPGAIFRPILMAMYLLPAVYIELLDYEHFSLEIVWILPLLALTLSDQGALRWSLPQAWRWPLVAWALVVAVSWPIVFMRETDFRLWVLPLGVANTSVGISPWQANLNVLYFVLGHNVGLLWIDALFRWFSGEPRAFFTSRIVKPLAAAAAIACLVGGYQALVDLNFLSGHLWPYFRRAAGTLADANAFGVIAALWVPGFVVLARAFPQPWATLVGIGGVTLASMGVLTSGSRTALILLTIVLAVIAVESVRAWRRKEGPSLRSSRPLVTMIAGAIAVAAIALLITRGSSIMTVDARGSSGFIPIFGDLGIRESARQLFLDRYGYAPAAVQMITEHPWAGVGAGAFHTLVRDFALMTTRKPLVPDNAQSWYRHLLAELGLLGSLPWIAWCVVFVSTLFSRAAGDRDRFSLGVLRGAFLAFGIIALIGMPGQSLTVILTFWTLVYWSASLKGITAAPSESTTAPWSKGIWAATLALVAVHAAITFADARGDLLPRNRSMRFGWDYRYGINYPEPVPDGGPGRRWADLKSMSVVPVRGTVLKFVAWIDHPDGDERPVHVRIWVDKKIVYDDDLKRSAAIRRDIPAPPGQTHIVVETEISRTWRPRDFGRDDTRELGLSIRDWTWE